MTNPRVVLLHPHCFSQRDMQFYVPLLDEFDIVAVTPRWLPDRRSYQGVPQIPLISLDQVVGAVGPVQRVLDRALRLRSENLYYFLGLEKVLSSAHIVECLETFHPYCWQAIRGKQRFGYKLAFSCHENIAYAHENLEFRRDVKQRAFAVGDAFFTLCEQGRNSLILEGAPGNKIHLSGMAVDTDLYAPGMPDDNLLQPLLNLPLQQNNEAVGHESKGEFTLLYAGRLVWEKGIVDAISALGLLVRDVIDGGQAMRQGRFRLLVAGDGPEAGALRTLVARLGIGDRVNFLGRVSTPQMVALYRRADLCLVPSIPTPKWQEQFGCVLIEAMGCGCPVVASDSGAIREVVGRAGRLVAPAQHTLLAEAIADLAARPDERRRMSLDGRARVVERYSNSVVADRIRAVYRRILGRNGHRREPHKIMAAPGEAQGSVENAVQAAV